MKIDYLKDARVGDIVERTYDFRLFLLVSIEEKVVTWLDIQRQICAKQVIEPHWDLSWHVIARCDRVTE
jgi:hypothetical protein